MQFDGLGRAITAPFTVRGAITTLYERGLVVAGEAGIVTASFGFVGDDGPVLAEAGPLPAVIGRPIELRLDRWHPTALEAAVRAALCGRLALREAGTRGTMVPVDLGPVELDDGGRAQVRCRARVGVQRLHDVLARGDGGWTVIARSAVYGRPSAVTASGLRPPVAPVAGLIGLPDLIGG
jgi:hypothetical protein